MTCPRTTSRRIRSPSSRIARRPRISGSTCCRRSPRATSAGSAAWTCSPGSRPRWRRWGASSASGATSTTGMTRATSVRWSRATCRPWTAGTSPAICSSSATPARARSHRPLLDAEAFAGIEDALLLVGDAARALGGGRSTQTVTLGQLDESRQALAAALREPPTSPAAWAARLRQLAVLADTLVDIARTLTAERGDGEHADLLAWAEATRAAIASHERVVLTLMPWAPHLAAALAPFATAPPEAITAIGVLLSSSPGPAALADHAEVAARELAALRDARLRDTSGARGRHRARRRDHRGAHGVLRRVPGARRSPRGRDHAREGDVRRDAVRLPLRCHAQDLLDRLPHHGRHPRSQRVRPPRLRGAADQLHRDRQGRRRRLALVSSRPSHDAGRARRRPRLLVRLDVRVSDAGARHARAGGQPAVPDVSPRRPPPDAAMARSRGFPGGSRSRPTTCATSS